MTVDELKAYLEEKIQTLGEELEECIMARKALLRAQSVIDGKARATPQLAKPKRKSPAKPDRAGARNLREQIVTIVEETPGSIKSKDIVARIYGDEVDEQQAKRAHNALWALGVSGKILKVGVATYQAVNHG
jgi:Mg2+ and Co2+ transporter CorA